MRRGLFLLTSVFLLLGVVAPRPCGAAEARPDPGQPVDVALAHAETALRDNERQIAESRYRVALLEGWLLMGELEAAERRWPEAKQAFERAAASSSETRRAFQSLAMVHLQMKEVDPAVALLSRVVAARSKDIQARQLLAQALIVKGEPAQAVQELEEARLIAPDDAELAFALATGYLRVKKIEAADRLFAEVARRRPLPQTHVLIGRMYRDFREFERARVSLGRALALDPRVRHAHFYLGTAAVLEREAAGIDEAIAEFLRELEVAPGDPLASQHLGIGLVEARRHEEALPHLERVTRSDLASVDAWYYLARALLAADRPGPAAEALERSLAMATPERADSALRRNIHYQLGIARRSLGQDAEAARHFAEAQQYSSERTEADRDWLTRHLAGVPQERDQQSSLAALAPAWALAALPPADRAALRTRVRAALARAYLNLGVMHAQADRFPRAAELLESAAEVDADFPQVQYSLGVAYFNAQRYALAVAPLTRALTTSPGDVGLRRMLALAHFNAGAYAEAVALLEKDPGRETSAELQYAYGAGLVRSGRTAEADPVFARLLARHGDSAELNVLIGQAYAQQGDYESATRALEHAKALKRDVAEADAALGVMYLKQGRLADAEKSLRAELGARPGDVKAAQHLAAVLEMDGRPDEAVPLLRRVLRAQPDFADARYLIGKILVAQGATAEAVQHLEVAARLQPEEANVRYQLGRAYQRAGRTTDAEAEMEIYGRLKEKRREVRP
jgi:tetratricopeptide (TPR) repeat protein